MKSMLALRPIALVMMLASLSGCVSAGKYHELEAEEAKNKQDLAATSTERNRLQVSVADMEAALADAQKRKAEADKRLAEFRELTDKFKKLVDAGKLSVKVVNGRMVIGLSTDILFASGAARLSAAGKLSVREVTGLLAGLEGRKYQIEGHTDNVPIKTGAFPSNWELASARAISVLNTMLDASMPPERVSAASFADTQPVTDNSTAEGRAANRRIAIVIVPDLSQLPGFDELNRISGASDGATAATPSTAPSTTPAPPPTNVPVAPLPTAPTVTPAPPPTHVPMAPTPRAPTTIPAAPPTSVPAAPPATAP